MNGRYLNGLGGEGEKGAGLKGDGRSDASSTYVQPPELGQIKKKTMYADLTDKRKSLLARGLKH